MPKKKQSAVSHRIAIDGQEIGTISYSDDDKWRCDHAVSPTSYSFIDSREDAFKMLLDSHENWMLDVMGMTMDNIKEIRRFLSPAAKRQLIKLIDREDK